MKIADGWIAYVPNGARPKGAQLVDIELPHATVNGIAASSVVWADVLSYRMSVATADGGGITRPADADDEASVTLNEARAAMLSAMTTLAQLETPTPLALVKLERVKDFLDQQVAGEVLIVENAETLQAENTRFRRDAERDARAIASNWDCYAHAIGELNQVTAIIAKINIAIARGHLPFDFEDKLDEWTA